VAISKSVSRGIVELLVASLKGYISDNRIIYEMYRVEPIQLESRQDIPMARIALYEDAENATEPVNDARMNIGKQNYLIDVSVVRAYQGDKANRGELVALDIVDAIKEWSKVTSFADVTGEYVYSFEYTSSTRFLRNDKYATRTLTFVATRDLYKDQSLPLGTGFPYTFDFKLA
jgi:hypothetical protein